jgi:C-terminal processing protease CtpA/Prc
MLDELNDAHVTLITPFGNPPTQGSFNYEYIRNMLNGGGVLTGDRKFLHGVFKEKPNVGYVHIAGFVSGKVELAVGPVQDWAKKIDGILQSLARTDFIILDIRGNSGGLRSNAEYIAGRFISVQKKYIKVCTKSGSGRNDFSVPVSRTIRPAGSGYTKPVVLLTDNFTMSAAEWFTLALRTQNHVTHAGETTRGALSTMVTRPLINGWEYTMSVQKVTDMKGNCYEGTGIAPVFPIAGHEAQLDYALNLFN